MRALVTCLVACACSEPGWIRRPQHSPRDFCHAVARLNLQDATWVMASKLDSIGGRGNEQSRDLVRAWLFRQPCVVDVRPPCFDSHDPALHVELERDLRVRVRLYRSGGATVAHTERCPGEFDRTTLDELLLGKGER